MSIRETKGLSTVILAAGEGTRMNSKKSKVLHKMLGKSLIEHVMDAAKYAGSQKICLVIGHKGEEVREAIGDSVEYAVQKERLGTGHAVMQADSFIEEEGDILVLYGDTPLITGETLKNMIETHRKEKNGVTILSAIVEDPTGYGRIIRDEAGNFIKIVEHKDASEEELKVREINGGMYCFQARLLKEALKELTNHNVQGEYYLTDTLHIILSKGYRVNAMIVKDSTEILGVNSRAQLSEVTQILKRRINKKFMDEGVTIIDPESTYIEPDVSIGIDTIIYPGSIIQGKTVIGEDCVIGPNARIDSAKIGNDVSIESSVILESEIGSNTTVGPFAYIRPNSKIGSHIKIGDFVEVKNSTIGNNTKVSHLTYIGDADVGENVNFGCGTVVVNYDGHKKHRTVIEDEAFIGCNTNLVSPVTIHKEAFIAAGSTITENVPARALGIARARQVNKENWVERRNK
ncbi:bifunctional UDP-N-acetylglucosamine diphosphorylase/glucosamine-1-phosphate N-acetyltransferase GlmU [Defluviitalea raffinosedens]|jgi:bifunctional UDP-N-acetylglucosamine pyrophosphorylase/glucosamine-1-phosphate N-acetyltransferase|uniref:bifunctional UDP-N-acetylglucosamine diphosphorylase/glucosamine-1-phosphate N-acetyltransferase GlmU n=1 Tax=Defluviitalea raffinosedens TaxID=1450156 RepID=UPI00175D3848|nr:bifunctional UDP-N-acetylglucosamine diphosphorylase/glucosamine-1-phosphate N-acetyltransferase GlmU [Defluviitalea raffinosedens]MBM7684945.1 bifunctional UDP-N-acetylglucosamine pyrophosphorylase/glucosamine-1-phosphate N-acetyltransferase [Defluviitalea raffinosedens]HHW66175.1 bifunctional UDP-N-acetylglucosamine diphosphorylase/glucosamine-1-phosphate N-acetyltransferase GlmU [Candidatus Epulonipiscium sp.]